MWRMKTNIEMSVFEDKCPQNFRIARILAHELWASITMIQLYEND